MAQMNGMEKRNFTNSAQNGGKTADMRNNSAKSGMVGMSDNGEDLWAQQQWPNFNILPSYLHSFAEYSVRTAQFFTGLLQQMYLISTLKQTVIAKPCIGPQLATGLDPRPSWRLEASCRGTGSKMVHYNHTLSTVNSSRLHRITRHINTSTNGTHTKQLDLSDKLYICHSKYRSTNSYLCG